MLLVAGDFPDLLRWLPVTVELELTGLGFRAGPVERRVMFRMAISSMFHFQLFFPHPLLRQQRILMSFANHHHGNLASVILLHRMSETAPQAQKSQV